VSLRRTPPNGCAVDELDAQLVLVRQEEVFGPVLSVIKYKDEDEAVEIANDMCALERLRPYAGT
jgi:delta 1-pyrroline-5-carboxylate dehydrogenase